MACSKFIFGYYFYLPFVLKWSCGSCVPDGKFCSVQLQGAGRAPPALFPYDWTMPNSSIISILIPRHNLKPQKAPGLFWINLNPSKSQQRVFQVILSTGIWEFLISQTNKSQEKRLSQWSYSGPGRKDLTQPQPLFKEVFRVIHN